MKIFGNLSLSRRKHFLLALLVSLLAGCTAMCPKSLPYLRVEDYYHGWNFIGAKFTPDVDVELYVFNAPVPCGRSFCGSGSWEPIGTMRSGPVGGNWPNYPGQFLKVVQRDEMTARRGMAVTCYPGEWWSLVFYARDPVTSGTALHHGATTSGFFYDLPRCP